MMWLPILLLIIIMLASAASAAEDRDHFWSHLIGGIIFILFLLALAWGTSDYHFL